MGLRRNPQFLSLAPLLLLLLLVRSNDHAEAARLASSKRGAGALLNKLQAVGGTKVGLKEALGSEMGGIPSWYGGVPYGSSWFSAYTPDEQCDHMCKSSCPWPEYPACMSCRYSCMSFATCDDSEGCLVDRTCSVYSFNKAVKMGVVPGEKVKPWFYCEPDQFGNDRNCDKCKECVNGPKCHWTIGGGFNCGGVWGDCCMMKCLGAGSPTFAAR